MWNSILIMTFCTLNRDSTLYRDSLNRDFTVPVGRNLGVHISKVKSVNLDSWTPQQVASMQLMGNSRARAVYEANLNDGFVRPQNDQALDQFIRAKYEKKKYIAKEYVPQNPPQLPEGWYELIEAEKMKKDLRKIVLPSHNAQAKTEPQEADKKVEEEEEKKKAEVKKEPPKVNKASEDILGLSLPPPSSGNADILSLDQTTSTPAFGNLVDVQQQPQQQQQHQQSDKKEEEDFFNRGSVNSNSSTATEDKSKMTKDSIMALFANKPNPAPTAIPSSNAFGTAQQQPQPQQGLFNQQQSAGNGSVFGQFSMAPPPPQQQNGFPQQQPNFGVNPQSNPFLAGQQQQNSSPSAFGNLQAAPASGQQNSSSNHFAAFGQVKISPIRN